MALHLKPFRTWILMALELLADFRLCIILILNTKNARIQRSESALPITTKTQKHGNYWSFTVFKKCFEASARF